jgi:methyl-accepting chemotaxis protein
MLLNNLKIWQKLALAFGAVVVINLALVVALFMFADSHARADDTNNASYEAQVDVEIAQGQVYLQSREVRGMIIAGNASATAKVDAADKLFNDTSKHLREQVAGRPELIRKVDAFVVAHEALERDLFQPQIRALSGPDGFNNAAGIARSPAASARMSEFNAAADDLSNAISAWSAAEDANAHASLNMMRTAVLVGGALALVLSGLMGWLLARLVATPVVSMTETMRKLAAGDNTVEVPGAGRGDEIGDMSGAVQAFKDAAIEKLRLEGMTAEQAKAAEEERKRQEAEKAEAARQLAFVVESIATGLEKLAAGDLVFRIDRPFADEYEKLRTDFNGAMGQLQDTMKVISGNVRGMRSGADEISSAADDLSKRTEQQAASLEETAAALDEITATVRKTAEGANHARDVVNTAKSDAERSGQVVRQAIDAMSEIEKSSSQISQIIGVIDEIAFQTNLLALNAGVEAARAGDAGKGFAVVASEVRALAQRSADAAKEIKTLISASTEQVGQGVSLVGETGEALTRIVAQVADITNVVSEIAASAQEQATGLHQVNTAVNQMDQVTQQNAAMVEQSTAASHSLAQEAEELSRLVGRFQVGEAAAAAQARPAARAARPAQPVAQMKSVSSHAGGGGALRKPEPSAETDSWEEF